MAVSALFTALLGALWSLRAPTVTAGRGLVMGMTLAAISPLGDLGESMIKRQFGVKDFEQDFAGAWGYSGPHRHVDLGRGHRVLFDRFVDLRPAT